MTIFWCRDSNPPTSSVHCCEVTGGACAANRAPTSVLSSLVTLGTLGSLLTTGGVRGTGATTNCATGAGISGTDSTTGFGAISTTTGAPTGTATLCGLSFTGDGGGSTSNVGVTVVVGVVTDAGGAAAGGGGGAGCPMLASIAWSSLKLDSRS